MAVLPTSARERVDRAALFGTLTAIQVRPERRTPVQELPRWDLGASPDHARSKTRAVTLIQAEHLQVVGALLKRPVAFADTRRNLLIEGLNLEVCAGRDLQIGEVVLKIGARCHPCERMEQALGRGGFAAMYGHGGWCASIVRSGVLRAGDRVELLPWDGGA